jgi:phage tail protein X
VGSTSSGQGGNITLTAGTSTGGTVTITGGTGQGTSGGGGAVRLTGGSQGSMVFTDEVADWKPLTMATQDQLDQLQLTVFDLQQTVKALLKANQRLCDEVEALKAGVILDSPDLA